MPSKQQKAIEVLRECGYVSTPDGDGALHLVRGGYPIDQKWAPQPGEGFLRFDRVDGRWEALPYTVDAEGQSNWVYPDDYIILNYSR